MKLIYPSILSSFIHIEHSHNANAEAIAYQTSHHKTRSPIKFSQEIKTFSSFVRTSILPFALKFCEITQLYQAARGQIRRDNTVEHFPSPAKFFGFGVFLFCFWLFVGFLVLGFWFFFFNRVPIWPVCFRKEAQHIIVLSLKGQRKNKHVLNRYKS